MPQIGWFELLIVVLVAILIIGPKDFPVVLRKLGSWIGSTKKYFSDIQNKINQTVDEENSVEKKYSKTSPKTSPEFPCSVKPIVEKRSISCPNIPGSN